MQAIITVFDDKGHAVVVNKQIYESRVRVHSDSGVPVKETVFEFHFCECLINHKEDGDVGSNDH
jgi:hypothetical protein